MSDRLDIAIVGFGGVFPGAESPQDFWNNIERGNDAAVEVPSARWSVDPDEAYSPDIAAADHVYSRRAGLLGEIDLDTEDLGIDAHLLDRLDPMFRVALSAAQMAMADGLPETLDRDRTGVAYETSPLPCPPWQNLGLRLGKTCSFDVTNRLISTSERSSPTAV